MDEALKRRIENRLKEFAAVSDISIGTLEWGPSNFEIGAGTGIQPAGPTHYSLAVTVGTNRKVIKFTEDELEDCILIGSQGNTAWKRIEHRLNKFVNEFILQKKFIGF